MPTAASEAGSEEDGSSHSTALAVVSLYDIQNPATSADSTNGANPGSLNLITDVKKVE